MKATNIEWDTDGADAKELGLPSEIEIPEDIISDVEDRDEMIDIISDYITDETGFCHTGFALDDE